MKESKLAILGKYINEETIQDILQSPLPPDYWKKDAELHNKIVQECEVAHEAIRMSTFKFHKRFTM